MKSIRAAAGLVLALIVASVSFAGAYPVGGGYGLEKAPTQTAVKSAS